MADWLCPHTPEICDYAETCATKLSAELAQFRRLGLEALEKAVNPPVVLGEGYCIPDCRPGAVINWRPLGRKERPLARLAGYEEGLRS